MPITRTYTITAFDTATSAVTMTVTATDTSIPFSYTVNTMYWLPVDLYGNVPTGSELDTILAQNAERVIPTTVFTLLANLDRAGGVTNPDEIAAIIDSHGAAGYPVLIYPDRTYNPLGLPMNHFTRSVIIAVGPVGRAPFVYSDYSESRNDPMYILDNGNIYGSGMSHSRIRSVIQIGSDAATQEITIVGSHNGFWPVGGSLDDTTHLEPPQYIIDQYPDVFRSDGGGSLKYYYVEHTPLIINTNIAGGFFTYS